MDYGRRALFILQVSFLIVFLPSAFLIGKGIIGAAERMAAEMGRVAAMTRVAR